MARRRLLRREVRIEGTRGRHATYLRPYRISRWVARSSGGRMGIQLLVASQESPLTKVPSRSSVNQTLYSALQSGARLMLEAADKSFDSTLTGRQPVLVYSPEREAARQTV